MNEARQEQFSPPHFQTVDCPRARVPRASRRPSSLGMGMCIGKKQLPDPNDLSRPADVPCTKCGEFNYIEEKKTAVKCFNCGQRVFRGLPGAEGMESAQEHSDKLPRSTNTQQFTLTGI